MTTTASSASRIRRRFRSESTNTLLEGATVPGKLIELQRPASESSIVREPVEPDSQGAIARLAQTADRLQEKGLLNDDGTLSSSVPEDFAHWLTEDLTLPAPAAV